MISTYKQGKLLTLEGKKYKKQWDVKGQLMVLSHLNNGQLDNPFGPASIYWNSLGELTGLHFYHKGQKHRLGGPQQLIYNQKKLVALCYYKEDKLDNSDGPAEEYLRGDGYYNRYYYRDGLLHRDDNQPAVEQVNKHSIVHKYYHKGQLHHPSAPAVKIWYHYQLILEEYYFKGMLHRDPDFGPARIERYPSSDKIKQYEYWSQGMRHRPHGLPAVYRSSAKGEEVEYWYQGRQYQ